MATVTHYIRSHYDPKDRERLERETGQIPDEPDSDPWQTESSFSAHRRSAAHPSFVAATISYDEWGQESTSKKPIDPPQPRNDLANWYRSLTAGSNRSGTPSQDVSLLSQTPSSVPICQHKRYGEAITKNNWFIKRALQSEPPSAPKTLTPSLADILARDPPPLPSEARYIPPVWLAIGPSNRGFNMLQKSGWNEGEGLGAHIYVSPEHDQYKPQNLGTNELRKVDIIDLTLSDTSDNEFDGDSFPQAGPLFTQSSTSNSSHEPHAQKSLLTPLPTVLKSDRLGIGLKAKTEGPYKSSKKRVTHNAAALAAHIKSAEEARRDKTALGRGRRGFAKARKREEESRKKMLAYLN
ncbi:hypothetical protein BJ138DRAFT_1062556, partial [Hygrophoropsis aurantiaca]